MYNEQWAGHGKPEMVDGFMEIVEMMPELHVGRAVQSARGVLTTLGRKIAGTADPAGIRLQEGNVESPIASTRA